MKRAFFCKAVFLFAAVCCCAACSEQPPPASAEGRRLLLTAGGTELVITLGDSRAAAELWQQLPLELQLEDHSGFAKGMRLPRILFAGEETTRRYAVGNRAYWPEGPGLAVFYQHTLDETIVPVIPLGRAEEGAAALGQASGAVRLEALPDGE